MCLLFPCPSHHASVHRAGRPSHHPDQAAPFIRCHSNSPARPWRRRCRVTGDAVITSHQTEGCGGESAMQGGKGYCCMSTRSAGWSPVVSRSRPKKTWGRWNADKPGEARLSGWCPPSVDAVTKRALSGASPRAFEWLEMSLPGQSLPSCIPASEFKVSGAARISQG